MTKLMDKGVGLKLTSRIYEIQYRPVPFGAPDGDEEFATLKKPDGELHIHNYMEVAKKAMFGLRKIYPQYEFRIVKTVVYTGKQK